MYHWQEEVEKCPQQWNRVAEEREMQGVRKQGPNSRKMQNEDKKLKLLELEPPGALGWARGPFFIPATLSNWAASTAHPTAWAESPENQ